MYSFTDDCLIGIKKIDNEHRHLFEIVNSAFRILQSEGISNKHTQLERIINELKIYSNTHFAHEEEYMESINDPELEIQKKQHLLFCKKIEELDIDRKNCKDEQEQQEMVKDMLAYLTRWLYHHILSSDIMIGKIKAVHEEGNPCEFTEKYLTGIDLIDSEHKILFEIMDDARKVINAEFLHDKYDEIVAIINQLRDYTKKHFRDEEEYMESINYKGLATQKLAHEAFIDKLSEINMDEVDDNQQEYLEDLMKYLVGWLINHILKMDKLIGK